MTTRSDLERLGFSGFMAVATLRGTQLFEVPQQPGVYALLRPRLDAPAFLETSSGGHFKGKDPTVPVTELAAKWVQGSQVVYIGKAGKVGSRATLRSRLKQYLEFGDGKPIGHWGGRYVWQLRESQDLLVAWCPTGNRDPETVESEFLHAFVASHGRLPFANLKAGRRYE